MIMASMAYLPADTASAAVSGKHVTVEVKDGAGHVAGAIVVLVDPYGRIPSATSLTGTDGNATFTAIPGMYQIKVNATGHFDHQSTSTLRVDSVNDLHTLVTITGLGTGQFTFNLTSGGTAVLKPSIVLQLALPGASSTTISSQGTSGNVTVTIPVGTYKMIARASGYTTNVSDVTVTSLPSTLNVKMVAATYNYTANVTSGSVSPINLKGFLIMKNGIGIDPMARITEGRTWGQHVTFDVTSGNYVMLISADNFKTYETEVSVTASGWKTVPFIARSATPYTAAIALGANSWNQLTINQSEVMIFDSTVPGLPFSDVPSARMQAELAFGNGDGVLDATETSRYVQAIASFGPYRVDTDGLLQVNSQYYLSVAGNTTIKISGMTGPVNSTLPVTMSVKDDYKSRTAISLGASSYTVNVGVEYDTPNATHSYGLTPPLHFEVTSTATAKSPSRLSVSGNFNVSILSTGKIVGDPDSPSVNLVIQHNAAPIARGSVTGPASLYYLVTVNATYSYYIVANNSNMTFSSSGSSDPNLNPLTFTWNFGDGAAAITTTFTSVRHTFTHATYFRNVTLTVKDITNLTSTAVISIKVDDQPPIPVISANGAKVPMIYASQKQSISFSQDLSVDYITGPSDPAPGVIHQYKWNFGDGTSQVTVLPTSLKNVSHAFAKAGTYSVWLNVTDSVGHVASGTMTVIVNDTESPVAKMIVDNAGEIVGSSAIEKTDLRFNASTSTDNSGSISTYSWNFGDGTTGEGMVVNHAFAVAGTYKVVLTVTDSSGNTGNQSKVLTIVYGLRPDIRALSVQIDRSGYNSGDKVTISMNLMNVGNGSASNIYVLFYLIDLSGNRVEIANSSSLFVNGSASDHLGPGETGYVSAEYTFASEGSFSLEAVAHTADEIKTVDDTAKQSISVGAPTSTLLLLAIVAALVIVAVAVVVVFRKRIFRK